jgi:hypothetical protein
MASEERFAMPSDPAVLSAFGRVAANVRHHGPDAPSTKVATAALADAKATAYIRAWLASETPPTQADRDRLALLLLRGDPS